MASVERLDRRKTFLASSLRSASHCARRAINSRRALSRACLSAPTQDAGYEHPRTIARAARRATKRQLPLQAGRDRGAVRQRILAARISGVGPCGPAAAGVHREILALRARGVNAISSGQLLRRNHSAAMPDRGGGFVLLGTGGGAVRQPLCDGGLGPCDCPGTQLHGLRKLTTAHLLINSGTAKAADGKYCRQSHHFDYHGKLLPPCLKVRSCPPRSRAVAHVRACADSPICCKKESGEAAKLSRPGLLRLTSKEGAAGPITSCGILRVPYWSRSPVSATALCAWRVKIGRFPHLFREVGSSGCSRAAAPAPPRAHQRRGSPVPQARIATTLLRSCDR